MKSNQKPCKNLLIICHKVTKTSGMCKKDSFFCTKHQVKTTYCSNLRTVGRVNYLSRIMVILLKMRENNYFCRR